MAHLLSDYSLDPDIAPEYITNLILAYDLNVRYYRRGGDGMWILSINASMPLQLGEWDSTSFAYVYEANSYARIEQTYSRVIDLMLAYVD